MRPKVLAGLLLVLAAQGLPARAQPNPASGVFTRAANSPAGHAAFDVPVDVTAGAEEWDAIGMDVVPFYFEQGMASDGDATAVFSSRNSLTRTAAGCADPLDPVYGACYDVGAENSAPIPPELVARGFDHVGGIDIGPAGEGPGSNLVFAPLETDPPRSVRAYGVYDLSSLDRVGLLVEEVTHRYNSWVAVDPSARFMIIGEDRWEPLRVYEIARAGGTVTLTRRPDLDVTGTNPDLLPNFQGCKFDGPTTLYCSNWSKRSSYFDVRSEVYRVDLSAPIGTAGATATSSLAFSFKLHPPVEPVTANVPYGLETEDLAFWGGALHVQVRGEAIGWVRVLHFARA
jgi:hypothetical protein